MATTQEYALLSLYVYNVANKEDNRPNLPIGWTLLEAKDDNLLGFSYGAFQRSGTGEIVLAYTGTNGLIDWVSNVTAGVGIPSWQAANAALVYQQIKGKYGSNITLSGHSLGGGLASVMATWFNRPAVVFDEAPFQTTAANPVMLGLVRAQLLVAGYSDSAMDTAVSDFSIREAQVANHYLQGEILNALRFEANTVAGSVTRIDINGVNAGAVQLHSLALLTAAKMSESFRVASYISTSVVPLIMDEKLYAFNTGTRVEKNFLLNLIRSEQSSVVGQGKLSHFASDLTKLGTNIAGLTKAAQDALIAQGIEWYYWQGTDYAGQEFFTQTGSLLQYTSAQGAALPGAQNKALLYVSAWLDPIVRGEGGFNIGYKFEQWNVVAGTAGATATALNGAKTQIYVGNVGGDTFTGGEKDDFLLGGAGADTLTGGVGMDHLFGGADVDILDGGPGGDFLYGGAGDDRYELTTGELWDTIQDSDGNGKIFVSGAQLTGGKKVDATYWISDDQLWGYLLTSTGNLVISKYGSADRIVVEGWLASGGDKLGIVLDEAPSLAPPRAGLFKLHGDQEEVARWDQWNVLPDGSWVGSHAVPGMEDWYRGGATANASVVGEPLTWADRGPIEYDGQGGTDVMSGFNFDDKLTGGDGNDAIFGGSGSDRIDGGAGSDVIMSSLRVMGYSGRLVDIYGVLLTSGVAPLIGGRVSELSEGWGWFIYKMPDGQLFAELEEERYHVPASENPADADFVLGGAGDDYIWGSLGQDIIDGEGDNDQVTGLGGADELMGGAGDDSIWGDANEHPARLRMDVPGTIDYLEIPQWHVVREADHGDDVIDGGAGNDSLKGNGGSDVLYGGADNDFLWGDECGSTSGPGILGLSYHGSDYLDGEDGDDYLEGGGRDDLLYGGAGSDVMWGDTSAVNVTAPEDNALIWADDYLDGEEGDDQLWGGGKDDTLFGGAGADTLFGDQNNALLAPEYHGFDYLDGEDGNDLLIGGGKDDNLFGGIGDDELQGDSDVAYLPGASHGRDYLDGEDGADTLFGQGGADTLMGGTGNDTLFGDAEVAQLPLAFHGADFIDGGAGDDKLRGNGGNDTLLGGEGADQLWGDEGDDRLDGGKGNDFLFGEAGNDTLISDEGISYLDGGEGDDTYVITNADGTVNVITDVISNIVDSGGNNTLVVSGQTVAGASTIYNNATLWLNVGGRGLSVTDGMRGTVQTFVVNGQTLSAQRFVAENVAERVSLKIDAGTLNPVLWGGRGADALQSFGAAASMSGGLGNDDIRVLGAGNLIHYSAGDGADTVLVTRQTDAGDLLNTLVLGEGIARADVVLSLNTAGALVVKFASAASDSITVTISGAPTALGVSKIHLADGTDIDVLSALEAAGYFVGRMLRGGPGADVLTGGGGHDSLYGDAGPDTLNGGAGNDTLVGEDGADTYLFGLGSGKDYISNADSDAPGSLSDTIQLGAGLTLANVSFERDTDNLRIRLVGTTDELTVFNYFLNSGSSAYAVDQIRFADGSSLGVAAVKALVLTGTPGNDALNGFSSDDTLSGLAGRDSLYGDDGNDTLDGGADNDSMGGGNGSDVYLFGRGDGQDTVPIWYDSTVGKIDTLQFKAGVSPAEVQLREVYDYTFRTNVALEVSIVGTTDKITFSGFLGNDDPGNAQNSLQQIRFNDGTTWDLATIVAKLLAGTPDADTLTGTISADTISGQASADNLSGLGGDDVLNGGTGNDTLTGGVGQDTLDGGADNDLLTGGADNDTYVFGTASGQDRVVDIAPDGGNIVRLAPDITPATLRLLRTGLNGAETMAANDSLVLTVDSTGARLWIDEFFQPGGKSTVSEICFTDGSGAVWTYADIVSRAGASSTGVQNTQTGTAGDDLFVVDHPADAIVEAAGGGLDTARSSVSYTLPNEVENLDLIGAFAVTGTGNASNNVLRGNDANNVLKGAGGTDQYYGGLGNDTYLHSAIPANTAVGLFTVLTPAVFESAGEGYDTLVTDAYSLAMPNNVERMNVSSLMYVYSFTYVVDAPPVYTYMGNGLDNTIDLSGGDFRKFGGINVRIDGGTGNDTMMGSYAYDTYVVDSVGDVVVEPSLGTGQVEASISYTLGANLADLVLTGAAPIEGTGNEFYNILDGHLNSAANRLVGLGGDDTYRVDVNDVVVEAVGGGNDKVLLLSATGVVAATVRVADWANVEGLELGSGLGDLTVLGNELNNTIVGSFGANTLQGMDGDDTLSNLNPLSVGLEVSGAHRPYPFQQDHIFGGNGNDTIYSYGGTDVIEGGAGQDAIHLIEVAYASVDGGAGNDVVDSYRGLFDLRFGVGSDHDTATASGNRWAADWAWQHDIRSVISLRTGTDASGLRFTRDGANLVVGLNGGADTVTVPNFFESALSTAIQSPLDAVRLADGTVLTRDAIAAGLGRTDLQTGSAGDDLLITTATNRVLLGGMGNDQMFGQTTDDDLDGEIGDDRLFGGAGSDLLTGGAGNDGLTGGHGADTYLFSLGWGADVVDEMQATEVQAVISGGMVDDGAVDAIVFDGSVAVTDIAATMVGVDLVLTHRVNGDSIKVLNYFDATARQAGQVELIRFADGTVWDQALVAQLGRTSTGTAGNDELYALSAGSLLFGLAGNDMLYGHVGADLLDGGTGDDQMFGDDGDDQYVVDSSADVVTEIASQGTDSVLASISYILGANVENLTLTGTAAINGTGNTLANVLTGNTANNTLSGGTGADTMAGGLGDDSYVVDNVADVVAEALDEGTDLVQSSVTYTLVGNVEKLTLTGSSAIKGTGNALDNVLTGNSAANVLTGGAGNDTYVVGTGDSTVELAGGGSDTVQSAVTWTLGAEVENLTVTGTTAINGTGNTLANVLRGNSAANTLNGAAGADTMLGGAGNDTYVVDNVADVVTENAAEGSDLVQASVSYTLGAEVEKLTLTGTTAINGTGNSLANTLTGNSGANILDGGAGADTMVGGAGNDTYTVDNAADVTTEAASAGTDTVLASLNWTLATNLENLTLTGTANLNATGNSVANVLTGNTGDNLLTGGAGNDTMVGGAGNDTYVLDVATDVVTEALNAGTDTVQIGVTYTLGANVENLTLTGSSAIKATGNALANVLTGNSGANVMTGGAGNDTYVVGTGDSAVELAGGGSDTVQSAITWTLGTELENLTLTGTSAVNGTGNTLANVLTGNSGNNTLTGAAGNDTLDGGVGVDVLVGGAGNDTFRLGRGYGADTLQENDATAGNTDVLQFLSGVAIDQVWFRHVGNNLEVSIIGTSDKMTLTNWYSGSNYHVEQLTTADGKVLQDSQVEALVSAMAPFATPALGQLTLPADYWAALSAVITGSWH